MAFDQATRGLLDNFVGSARSLLTEEFKEQLQSIYGIDPEDGTIHNLNKLNHLSDFDLEVAKLLRETVDHYMANMTTKRTSSVREVLLRIVHEQSFTFLNQICAVKMAEARDLCIETVTKYTQSTGFQLYSTLAGGALGETSAVYRVFLRSVFDDFSFDLSVLFDRYSPESLLFPRESAIAKIIELVNSESLSELWKEDETIGWVYQYFNSKAERKAMRDASQAPRNSRELAVRNQFFTPRYVVEFLTDNTLGRIWYEMMQGNTNLKETCSYLVRRPDEVFLSHMTKEEELAANEELGKVVNMLQEGTEDTFPPFTGRESDINRIIQLAHTVDGYARHPFEDKVDGEWWPVWKKRELEKLESLVGVKTQDLLDVLFAEARADRHDGGTGEVFIQDQLLLQIANEVRRRVTKGNADDTSQEVLLNLPLFISFREKKDPRDFKVLDPACGSGHFLLYAFDLLESIYEEAWAVDDSPKSEASGRSLQEDFNSLEELKIIVPKLIIEYNLHGIDIDHRAAQIAALALWLRAQRSWKNLGVESERRPIIKKSNIVTAEPMPGDENLKNEFVDSLKPRLLGQLVDVVFEKMELAGEAGSLLKIEEEITDVVAKAKEEYNKELKRIKDEESYLPGMAPKREQGVFDFGEVSNEEFFNQAEEAILNALKKYAEQAENGKSMRRRLFAEDAARGFAFIDLCRKKYDAVLMNPPFGLSPKTVSGYFKKVYPDTYVDLYACSVTRGRSLSPSGSVGAITSRAFLTTKKLVRWRTNEVVEYIQVLLDLGLGVMDDAFVEACAYVLFSRTSPTFVAFNRRDSAEKDSLLNNLYKPTSYVVKRADIRSLPSSKLLYSVSPRIHSLLRSKDVFEPTIGTAREGLRTFDDFRFLRLKWEVNPNCISSKGIWEPLAKGGEFSRYYSDLPLLVRWLTDGRELAEENRKVNGQIAQSRQASDYYRRAGGTYSKRSAKGFSLRVLPAGCIIGTKGPAVLSESRVPATYLIGWLNSRLIRSLIHIQANAYEFNTGILKRLPWRYSEESEKLTDIVTNAILSLRLEASSDEVNSCFSPMPICSSLKELAERMVRISEEVEKTVVECQKSWDYKMDELYNADSSSLEAINENNIDDTGNYGDNEEDMEDVTALAKNVLDDYLIISAKNIISYAIGTSTGRWDVRIILDPSLSPDLPDPFDLLPICPPGMLVSLNGLPAEPDNIVSEEWLRARRDVNTLMLEDAVNSPTIPDSEYPLRIAWNGILVDDAGFTGTQPHRADIVRHVQELFDLFWKEKAHEIEQEACDILGISELRDYFRKPAKFFQDHLKKYSKSRRKAPIYWPLSTESGSYTLWIYYHRLTDQTLYACVNDYVDNKIEETEQEKNRLKGKESRTTKEQKELEYWVDLEPELVDFREELLRLAPIWKPNLNDGVQITAAPLWKLFQYKPWQKVLKETWEKLEKGDYDWAHLAYSLWPDRVREKCKTDKSLAIAHGLEELYNEPR